MNFIRKLLLNTVCKDGCKINNPISNTAEMYAVDKQNAFNELKRTIQIWIEGRTYDEQLAILNYIIEVLKEDLCSGNAAKVIMNTYSSLFKDCIPCNYTDENGNNATILIDKKISVNLADTSIYVCPWDKSRIPPNLIHLSKNPFEFDDTNHSSNYYTDIDLCHVYNGNHSIHIGGYLKKVCIKSDLCRTELLYPHCSTDGLYWYNRHNEEKMAEVSDFRAAALYYAAQFRFELGNS